MSTSRLVVMTMFYKLPVGFSFGTETKYFEGKRRQKRGFTPVFRREEYEVQYVI